MTASHQRAVSSQQQWWRRWGRGGRSWRSTVWRRILDATEKEAEWAEFGPPHKRIQHAMDSGQRVVSVTPGGVKAECREMGETTFVSMPDA